MDISIIGNNSIKLKGKKVTFIVDPSKGMPKTSADSIIFLNGINDAGVERVTDFRMIIKGPGGYEIGGAKVSGVATPKGTIYKLFIDGISIIIGRTAEHQTNGNLSCQIAIINADSEFKESFVTTLEPKIAVIYGDEKEESAKKLGLTNVTLVPKITATKDKLPEEMEIVVLN